MNMNPVNIEVYRSIICSLESYTGLHVNENVVSFLSPKFNSLPVETLRSIIGLWHQKKVTFNSVRIKDIDIYAEYKKLKNSGEQYACLYLAKSLDYPPALIAKIVLTGYQSESKNQKTKSELDEIKNLRKPVCACCTNKKLNKSDKSIKTAKNSTHLVTEDSPLIKRHTDPRVELALNLFDDDDHVGKYFLEKFKYFQDRTSKSSSFVADKLQDGSKANKFFRQASSFEEMGEKNVMKYKNIERLFSTHNNVSQSADEVSAVATSNTETSSPISTDIVNRIECIKLESEKVTENAKSDVKCAVSENTEETFSVECVCDGINNVLDDSESDDSDDPGENLSVRELLENTSLIDDPVLARDVFICTLIDDQYGPTSDIIANSLGITYEKRLEEYVKEAGLPYRTEDKLRGVGVDKTPDIILLVPVAVDGFVINWIESKALFADKEAHQGYKRDQFKKYINRFGPGLVIYWHGFVDELPDLYLQNKQIIIRQSFPSKESFTFVNSEKFKLWMQN